MNRNSAIRLAKHHLGTIRRESSLWIRFNSMVLMSAIVRQHNLTPEDLEMSGFRTFLKKVKRISGEIDNLSRHLENSLPFQSYLEEEI